VCTPRHFCTIRSDTDNGRSIQPTGPVPLAVAYDTAPMTRGTVAPYVTASGAVNPVVTA